MGMVVLAAKRKVSRLLLAVVVAASAALAALILLRPLTCSAEQRVCDANLASSSASNRRQPSKLCPEGVPSVHEVLAAVDLVRDNLLPDFGPWVDARFTLEDIEATAAMFKEQKDVTFLIRIESNTWRFLDRDDDCAIGTCNPMLYTIRDAFENGWKQGRLSLPNVTFILNVFDDSVCSADPIAAKKCAVPVLSVNRRKGHYLDILVPNFDQPFEVHSVPWSLKKPRAFFRGSPFCNGVEHYIGIRLVNCSRLILSEMSAAHPDLLNVSINEDFDWQGRKWDGVPGRPATRDEHAEYQMLLNLDGYAASTRLTMLLAMNSVVLKQESVFEEHFYRSLRPCVHYLPFWQRTEEDILDVIVGVQAEPLTAQRIAANAQAFAMMHLTDDAKYRYWEEVLTRYAALME